MPPTTTVCPCCNAAVPAGASKCRMCKLEVAKMAAFASAKAAAQKRGIKTTQVQRGGGLSTWPYAGLVIELTLLVLVLGGLGGLGWHFFGPKPPRYLKYPATAQQTTEEFMRNICGGDATYDQAYFYIADAARSTKADDDRGDYVQIFHLLNEYLTDEFGADWFSRTTCAPDPATPDVVVVSVSNIPGTAAETLHIRTAQQTPPDKMDKQGGAHYGVLGIDELDVAYAGDLRRNAFIHDAIGLGGSGATSNWDTIMGANAGNLRGMPTLVRKMLVLSALRNPRAATGHSVVQANVFRVNGVLDPVIKARLEALSGDGRYDADVRTWAKKALDGKIDETDEAGAGV